MKPGDMVNFLTGNYLVIAADQSYEGVYIVILFEKRTSLYIVGSFKMNDREWNYGQRTESIVTAARWWQDRAESLGLKVE